MTDKILLLLQLITAWTVQIQKITALIEKARAEGRDITDEEIDSLVADDDAAKLALDQAIEKAKSEGR